ncbi:MAG: HAMP domain-containing histidine kinase [Kordiimonadaceae bacterium]|nr:HAMP domain-containing histidine kinase [Kordiimonadaceae bacterium]
MDYLYPGLLVFGGTLFLLMFLYGWYHIEKILGDGFVFILSGILLIVAAGAIGIAGIYIGDSIFFTPIVGQYAAIFGGALGVAFLAMGLRRWFIGLRHWFKYTVNRSNQVVEPKPTVSRSHNKKEELQLVLKPSATREKPAYNSQDLMQPLNDIVGFSKFAKSDAFGVLTPRQFREYANHIHRCSVSLLEIVNNMLEQGRVEAGQMALRETQFDLGELMQTGLRRLAPEIERKGLSLVTSIPKDFPLYADEHLVHQVILNLVSNAVKHTEPAGVVTVAVFPMPDGGQSFIVKDTGCGMKESEIKGALQPFSQLNHELGTQTKGVGLGLALVKAFMELHGGDMVIESKVGRGTSVCVIFPPHRTGRTDLSVAG